MRTRMLCTFLLAVALVSIAMTLRDTPPDITGQIAMADTLPPVQRIERLVAARHQLEIWLAGHPADTTAWQQLAYLRQVTQGDAAVAQQAQQVSALAHSGHPAAQQASE